MFQKTFFFFMLCILLGVSHAEARVFNISQESFATYIRGSYAPTAITNTAFSESNGANTTVEENFKTAMSGEFGFTYATPSINFRAGFEVLKPAMIKDTAVNGSGAAMYDIVSEASVLAPKVGLEFNLKKWDIARFFLNAGVGTATLTVKNAYTFTPAGSTAYSVSDYSEELKSTAMLYDASFGIESLLSDATTWTLEAGYRMLNFTEIKHNKDNTVIGPSAVTSGSVATNADGTNRKLNLSGYYLGFMLRIWIM